ncbi:MAG: GNAT family N-acetyltransferase [Bacteroidota bacterium]
MNLESIYTYRDATHADIEQLKQLGLASYGKYAPNLTADNLEKLQHGMASDKTWLDVLAIAKSFLCVYKDKIVAMAFIVPRGNAWEFFENEWSYIRLVGVHPLHEGRGLAKALTQRCIDHAISSGERVIALHTSEQMKAARHIYERLGFKILRELEPRLGMKYWLYTLEIEG